MKARVANIHRDKSMLVSVAESIGSTLGTIAAKVNAVQKVTLTSKPGSAKRRNKPALKAKKSGSNTALSPAPVTSRSKAAKKIRGSSALPAAPRARASTPRSIHK